MIGRIRSSRPALEGEDALERRIHEVQRFLGYERLAFSPPCGFALMQEGNPVRETGREARLPLLAETAHEVWGKRW